MLTEEQKQSNRESARRFALENPERAAATKRRYQLRHPDRCIRARARWKDANLEKDKAAKRKYRVKKYGLTPTEWEAIFEAQGRRCAICRVAENNTVNDWHIDHSHITGKVRGILCHGCNTGLGLLRDNSQLLRAAAEYLERAQ